MVEVGSLVIGGSLDSSGIEKGLSRVNNGLINTSIKGKSVNTDFVRLGQQVLRTGLAFAGLGVAAVGTMIALARNSPALAPIFAQLGITTQQLSFTLGDALAPAMSKVNDLWKDIAETVSRNKEFIMTVTVKGVEVLEYVWELIKKIGAFVKDAFIPPAQATIGGVSVPGSEGINVVAGGFSRIPGVGPIYESIYSILDGFAGLINSKVFQEQIIPREV